jgi:MFS family permease
VSSSIGGQSLIQHLVDDRFRGRIVSLSVALGVGGPALGTLAIGWVAESFGMQQSLTVSSVILILVTLYPARILLSQPKDIESKSAK